ncbi:C-Myc-binding protein, partial [Stegodyphus mimosarum]
MSVPSDSHAFGHTKSHLSPTVDSQREEFRKYLESSGLLDVLTRVMKDLYEEEDKPADPLNYFIKAIEAVTFEAREIKALNNEIQKLESVIHDLEAENKYLR